MIGWWKKLRERRKLRGAATSTIGIDEKNKLTAAQLNLLSNDIGIIRYVGKQGRAYRYSYPAYPRTDPRIVVPASDSSDDVLLGLGVLSVIDSLSQPSSAPDCPSYDSSYSGGGGDFSGAGASGDYSSPSDCGSSSSDSGGSCGSSDGT